MPVGTLVVLGHGAAGNAETMRPYVDGLRARGVDALAIDLPKRGRSPIPAEAAVPVFGSAVTSPDSVVGGHSYGGRVASLVAADRQVRGLVLFSYPLHAPGRFDAWSERTSHWPRIACPVLLLSGDADPFARPDLLREAVARLPQAELVRYPAVRHGVGPVLDDALDRVAAFVRSLPAS